MRMWEFVVRMFRRYRELIMYVIFGGLTTLVNAAAYFAASWGFGLAAWLSSMVSWVFAVAFAFVTNKRYVFESRTKIGDGAGRESLTFFLSRVASLLISTAILLIFVDIMRLNEPVFFVVSQVSAQIFNYVASKFWVFRK